MKMKSGGGFKINKDIKYLKKLNYLWKGRLREQAPLYI